MTEAATAETTDVNVDQSAKEAYFTAGQGQLIWSRFKKQKAAMVGAGVLILLILSGLFAPFLTPYDPTINGRNADYQNGAPNIPSPFRSPEAMRTASMRACSKCFEKS